MNFKVEQIDSHHQRIKVHGGWLVKAHEGVAHLDNFGAVRDGWDWRVAMAFVPDHRHQWIIDKEAE